MQDGRTLAYFCPLPMRQGIMLCVVLFCCLKFYIILLGSCYFGSGKADCFQVLYFKLAKDDKGFESMICSCSCNKSSSSPLHNPKLRQSSKSCKSCGGKLPVDGRGARRGSMLSNGGLELSRVIDPHLTWKTASNGRQRAVRRARTSFTVLNRKSSPAKSSKANKDSTDKVSKSTGDMPVSESEKVGVSILGRRFSDTLGSVPIKKRRFLLPQSYSPPHHSSSYSDDSGHTLERKTVPYQGAGLSANQHSLDINLGSQSVRKSRFEKIDPDGVNEKICDTADFSGISILAAAACDGNIGGESMNVECSLSKLHPSEVQGVPKENAKSELSPHEKEEAVLQTSEDLVGRTDLPFEVFSSSALPSKESNEVKSDGSSNLETSLDSSQNAPNRATDSSSCDVKFHWDLNTVMDVWESHEDVLNSDQEVTDNGSNDADHNEKLGNVGHFMDQVGFGDTKIVPTDVKTVDNKAQAGAGEHKVICASELKTKDNFCVSSDNSASDSKENKPFFSDHGDMPSEEQYMKDAKMSVAAVCEETKSLINNGQSYSVSGNFPFPTAGTEASAATNDVVEEGKAEAHSFNFNLKVENGNSSSCLVSCDNKIADYPTSVAIPHHEMDKRPAEAGTDVQVAEITPSRSPQAENQEFLCVGSADVNLLVGCLAEKGSVVLADENMCENMVNRDVISGAYAHKNPLDETCREDADKSGEKDECECETTATEMMMDNTDDDDDDDEDDMDTDDMDAPKSDFPANICFELSVCKLTEMTHGTHAPPALTSQGPCVNNTDGSVSNPGQVVLENLPECRYYPVTFQNDADQAPGMEKIEFLGDDDSQYEDGEFRESLANCWLDDGTEEGETEHVDYGTDRDTDNCEAASDFSSVNRHVVNNAGLPDASHDIQYQEVGRDTQNTSRSFLNFPSSANVSDAGSGKNTGSATRTGLQGSLRTAGIDVPEGNDVGDNGFVKEAYDARRSGSSASLRKMSGWDRLPGGGRSSGNGVIDSRFGSISQNHSDASSDPYHAVDSINRAAGSSLRRDLSSRMERVQSSDMLRRNDKSYVRPSRSKSNDPNGFNLRVERDRDDPRSIGRSGPSLHLQGRGRGDHWVNSPNHYGNSRNDSSGYYGSASFAHHGSRNAAAAAVAKVESNGFVVAPDGTIVKAGGAGSAGHLTRRSVMVSSQSTHRSSVGRGSPIERERPYGMSSGPGRSREMSPDRPMFGGRGKPGRYGLGMDGVSHRERYRGSMPDDTIDSSSSMRCTISRRDCSFSPHRRPLHLSRSHSRSPSRSRTRSPRWASPRGRGDSRTNGGPSLRRRSRSPNYKSEVRMDRPRAGFGERIANYASLSRNHTSPPHASRWIDGSKEVPEHFRDYEYRRCPGRSPPGRVFSRSHRVDLIDSSGRVKPDEYYRPTNSGRFLGFNGFCRGSRHDGKGDDRRELGDRYEVLHSARQYVKGGNMKRLQYDNENGFMDRNPRPNLQRRESPRAIDRGTERQLGDSPRRSTKVEKGNFGNGRDGNNNANFKSFGVRDGDDNINADGGPL